jgi:hypothetical protein
MTSAISQPGTADSTELRHIVRSGGQLGVLQSVLIGGFALIQPRVEGVLELVICGAILVVGIAATIALPGIWTKALTIEGIAGAAGIGLIATAVYLVIDMAVLQPLQVYTNRWQQIGGGSNWWYHPVWWMVGTYLPWLGAWVLANQTAKSGVPSPITLILATLGLAALIMVLASVGGFPGAALGLGTFGVSVVPALALLVAITGIGGRSR